MKTIPHPRLCNMKQLAIARIDRFAFVCFSPSLSFSLSHRSSLIDRYRLHQAIGDVTRKLPVVSSLTIAGRLAMRWLLCRCMPSYHAIPPLPGDHRIVTHQPASAATSTVHLTAVKRKYRLLTLMTEFIRETHPLMHINSS
jgi:hypothetical protein